MESINFIPSSTTKLLIHRLVQNRSKSTLKEIGCDLGRKLGPIIGFVGPFESPEKLLWTLCSRIWRLILGKNSELVSRRKNVQNSPETGNCPFLVRDKSFLWIENCFFGEKNGLKGVIDGVMKMSEGFLEELLKGAGYRFRVESSCNEFPQCEFLLRYDYDLN